jgi:Beta-galactosidase
MPVAPKRAPKARQSTKKPAKNSAKWPRKFLNWWKSRRLWHKIALILVAFITVFTAQAYAIAYWYQQQHKDEKLTYGVTFIANYARYFDLDPQETFLALRDDLGFKRFRLVSYWKNIEPVNGQYDFSELDWQFEKVKEVDGKVTLAIGLRQPRWPECHFPEWVPNHQDEAAWYGELEQYMTTVIERYKDHPSLDSYQLENEHFLTVFGECPVPTRERLQKEFDLVKSLDKDTPVIISYANNYFGVSVNEPLPDIVGVSVYKRVFDYTVTKRYFEYPFTPWYYAWRAGQQEILTGRSSMLHELQAEPWAPVAIKDASIEEQSKSMNSKRLTERIKYGKDIGFKDIDLWGGEWWYWRKVKFNDPSLWETVRANIPPENF